MNDEPVLPLHQRERRLAFNAHVDRAPNSHNGLPLLGRLKDSSFGGFIANVWRVCTTTLEGSLSETFRLVGSEDDTDARTSVSGMSKLAAQIGKDGGGDDFLDAVVVDNDDHIDEKHESGQHQSDSSMRSGQGGSNSTGLGMHRTDVRHGGDDRNYQGGVRSWLLYRGWPALVDFFEPRFPEHEEEFQRQTWHSVKLLAFAASLFLVLNWVLYLALNNDSNKTSAFGRFVYWVGFTVVTFPVPFMVALDMPRKYPVSFQVFFCLSVWYCAFTELIQMRVCNFFDHADNTCSGKDFLAAMYYSTAYPALMMFIVSKRLYNFIAQVIFFVLLVVLIIPVQGIYARNVVSFAVFSLFVQGLHYTLENSRRTMFLLALQLKQAYKAKHKARLAESKASFTKRRRVFFFLFIILFVVIIRRRCGIVRKRQRAETDFFRFANYIFHEVRVPLNNAVLAFQLLQSGNAFKQDYAKSTEVYALEQGLKMMKTVLNDVLDFEKMDSGHFETIARPFPLHHSIRAILDQVEVQTVARSLVLDRALDERIDVISNANLPSADALTTAHPNPTEPEGLWVLGSELRLQQVLTNLAANAVKYTPEGGGSVRISTEFLGISTREELPGIPPDIDDNDGGSVMDKFRGSVQGPGSDGRGRQGPGSDGRGRRTSGTGTGTRTQCLDFRLVVHDSGPGIKPSDLVEDRLFQPFVQTTVGQSSGSGTGLGLAIVKQIVRLSRGRLGVTSRRGEGSTFWIELSYPIASVADIQAARDANAFTSADVPQFTSAPAAPRTPSAAQTVADTAKSSPNATPAFAAAATSKIQAPEPRAAPGYESNPDVRQLPPAAPLTPLGSLVSPADPLLVLVVDDDAVTRVLSSKLLKKLGCVVHTAKDGRECVDMVLGAKPNTYDLVCLDNFMPVMTGEEAVKEIRSHDRDDFIVGCTGNALTEDQDSYREAGADEVMVKPVMIHDFKRLIQLAHQRRLERRARAP
ncbi:hypothetical protein B0H16DRAFT_1883289 [Mycena metata]|uniref:histidine kinase n=1 Tax=Mycena metata TaxID=1033252 RepID=A0AAD7JKL8_9AGAR|nr:hypothetical protein B0H16DRAFT_1883289 [Mycena metata]